MNPAIENQIRECEARLYAAMLASNVAELDALIAHDLLFVGPVGELATKEMDLELHRSGEAQFRELVPKELDVRVWSDDFVLASAKIFLSGTFSGNDFAGDCRYTRVWRQGKNGWQIVAGSVNVMA